ncbi:MAG TPA: LCCL domain-containing protein, partial [Candidatus Limnocylindrales bacterium]|nr:LCCL domain-containing protein [Candidatus Limnocylindrales bacterium]
MMQDNVWRRLSVALVMACMLMVALPAAAQDSPVQIECGSTVASLGLVDAESALLACPADCAISAVWGTDIYTDDSDICTAARHAGVIDVRGGQFRLLLLPGETSYVASAQNGVTSDSWRAWERSIGFEATEATGMLVLDCETRADALDLAEGEAMDVTCPAGCDTGRLWGTDIYTADSTVCWAAQHAGVIRI